MQGLLVPIIILALAALNAIDAFVVIPNRAAGHINTHPCAATKDANQDHNSSFSSTQNENVDMKGQFDRRSAIETSGKVLAGLILSSTLNPVAPAVASSGPTYDSTLQTIIMTGCNSGIGYDAVKRMAERGHTVVMACRTLDKAKDAANRIQNELSTQKVNLIPTECNLADLNSVKNFAKGISDSGMDIDVLCLNAGIARNTSAKDVLRTKEGFELTIGTNHLGHFYLTQSILPLLEKGEGKGKRIVVTASGVHDPESPGGAQGSTATLGDLSGLEKMASEGTPFDMVDGGSYDADKAYKDSKLCNVMFTRELQRRLNEGSKNINVNCFNPGLIVSTGLFRDQNPVFTKIFDFAATDLLKVGETIHWGGGALEYMALDSTVSSKGGLYYTSPPGSSKFGDNAFGNQFALSDVSKEAKDDNKARRLWELSEKLVGGV